MMMKRMLLEKRRTLPQRILRQIRIETHQSERRETDQSGDSRHSISHSQLSGRYKYHSRAKGGLITLIKDSLNYIEIASPGNIECITVNIRTDNSHVTVSNLYISPDESADIDNISRLFHTKTVIVGDLNSKSTLWGSPNTDQRGLIIEN